jgi:hypothetical protein
LHRLIDAKPLYEETEKMKTPNLIAPLVGAGFAALASAALAGDGDEEEPFDEAHIFFELNNTDGDLGIHALIDGEAWKRLSVEDQQQNTVLDIFVRGRMRQQGLTEIFFESAEPPFDELSPQAFFRRFPAGQYEVEGRTLDGHELESKVRLTHRMPAPAQPTVNGQPMAVQCDEDEAGYDAPTVAAPVTIAWPAVVSTHPDLGSPRSSPNIRIRNYELVVETELDGPGGEFVTVFSAVLPADVTLLTIPDEFLSQSEVFKYEVLAREKSFNQTAVESCFLVAD